MEKEHKKLYLIGIVGYGNKNYIPQEIIGLVESHSMICYVTKYMEEIDYIPIVVDGYSNYYIINEEELSHFNDFYKLENSEKPTHLQLNNLRKINIKND